MAGLYSIYKSTDLSTCSLTTDGHLSCYFLLPWTLECKCVFISFGHIPKSRIAGSLKFHINNLGDCYNVFQSAPYHFTFPWVICKHSNSSATSPLHVIICLCRYSRPSGCRVVAHSISLCISIMTMGVEHLFVCLSGIHIFGEMSIQMLCPLTMF